MLHLAPTLARPGFVPAPSDLDSALQSLWERCSSAGEDETAIADCIDRAVSALRDRKRRFDPTSCSRNDILDSDDEQMHDSSKRARASAPGGGVRKALRNKAKSEALQPVHVNVLMTHPITGVSGACIDAAVAADHLATTDPELKIAFIGARAAAVCANASLSYAGISGASVPANPTADEVRAGLSSLIGRMILVPGRVNSRAGEVGRRNSARTNPFKPEKKHPVAMQPLVWLYRDGESAEGDDKCLALLLPLCEEGYNLPGPGRVRLPGQAEQFEDVWIPCAVVHVYGPQYTWSFFQGHTGDPRNPWAKNSRLNNPETPLPRDFFGWGLLDEGREQRRSMSTEGGRLLSVLKMLQGSTRTLGPDVPIHAAAGVLTRLRDSNALDDALRQVFSHDKLKEAMRDGGRASYETSYDESTKEALGLATARRVANPCGLDLRAYLLQEVLLAPTPLAPLLTNTLVDEAVLQGVLPPAALSSVPALWVKLQAAATAAAASE